MWILFFFRIYWVKIENSCKFMFRDMKSIIFSKNIYKFAVKR